MSEQNLVSSISETNQNTLLNADQANARTQVLRAAIRTRIQDLITEGAAFIRTERKVNKANSWLREQMHPEARGVYKCRCCSEFFEDFSRVGYVNFQGSAQNILAEVLNATLGTNFPTRAEIIEPMHLTTAMTNAEKGGWEHYFAFTPEEIEQLNEDYVFDPMLAAVIARNYFNKRLPVKDIAQFIADVEEKIYNKAAFGPVKQFLEFMKTAPLMNVSAAQAAALVNVKEYRFLRHLNGTAAHTYFISPLQLAGVYKPDPLWETNINDFNRVTDPDVYKKKVAEANTQNLLQMQKLLEEKGCENIFERRLASIGDVKLTWMPVEDDKPEPEVKGTSLMHKLVSKAVNEREESKGNDYSFSGAATKVSFAAFSKLYPQATAIKILGGTFYVAFTSIATKPGNFDEIMNCGENASTTLMFTNPVQLGGSEHDVIAAFEVPPYSQQEGQDVIHFVIQPAIKHVQSVGLDKLSGGIIGTCIKSKYNGISRPLTELAAQVALEEPVDKEPWACTVPVSMHRMVALMDPDGIWKTYQITSKE